MSVQSLTDHPVEAKAVRTAGVWYLVETLPRREQMAISNLGRQDFPTFWPRFWKTRRHARKQDTVLVSLFPGYLFVRLDMQWRSWRPINGTYGVRRLVLGAGDRPQPVPQPIMDYLFARCRQGVMTRASDDFPAGQQVRIISGAFAEQIGAVEHFDGQGRVRVLLEILGHARPIAMEAGSLEPM